MKQSKLSLLAFLAIPLLSGCSTNDAGSVTLTVWEDQSNVAVVQELCDEFVRLYSETYHDVELNVVVEAHKEKSAIEDMASGKAEAGEGPDIAAVTHDTIASGVTNQLVAKVSFSDALKARMTEAAMNAVTVNDEFGNGVVYGYPITAESVTIMYDKTKISAAELASFEALKESGKKIAWPLSGDDAGYYTWGLFTDSVLFGANGKDTATVNIGTDQSSKNVKLFFDNYLDSIRDLSPETALSYVNNGSVAGIVTSPFMLNDMQNALGSNLALAPLPTLNGQTLNPFSGYKAYVVSRYSKHGAIAQELCNYITSYDANLYRLTQKGYLPAVPLNANERIERAINNSEFAKVFKESLEVSRVMPNIAEMRNFWSPMNNAIGNFKDTSVTKIRLSNNTELTIRDGEGKLIENAIKTALGEVTNKLLGK